MAPNSQGVKTARQGHLEEAIGENRNQEEGLQTAPKIERKLTRQQLSAGLDELQKWYPEESARIERYRETILAYAVDGVAIPADHPIFREKRAASTEALKGEIALSPCARHIAGALAEAATFIIIVAGFVTARRFSKAIDRWVSKAFFEVEEYETGFMQVLKALNKAEGAWNKAEALAPVAMELWQKGLLRAALDAIKENATVADWIITGAIVVAQVGVWLGTEFLAAVAEFAVVILSATHLALSVSDAVQVCESGS